MVNELARDYADDANAEAERRRSSIRVTYQQFSEASVARYHAIGLTPTQTLAQIVVDQSLTPHR